MEYIIENEYLKVTVTTWGAQVKSVVRKCDGVEHMWQADKSVWGYHAPILFPHCGKLVGGKFEAKGKVYDSPQHGFARVSEHDFVSQTADSLVLELRTDGELLEKFPYECALISTFTLEGDTLHHTLTVENWDEEKLPFGIGFHPGFTVPFDDKHTFADYEFRFSEMESPLCLDCLPTGLVNGKAYYAGSNLTTIPLTEHLFDNDSLCMANLQSRTLGIYEKDTGRAVVCDIQDFPYCLIWSKPGAPKFVCIEPWNSLPSYEGGSIKWEEKPAAAVLNPGESWSTTLSTRFVR